MHNRGGANPAIGFLTLWMYSVVSFRIVPDAHARI
jgi:hypothetical protein